MCKPGVILVLLIANLFAQNEIVLADFSVNPIKFGLSGWQTLKGANTFQTSSGKIGYTNGNIGQKLDAYFVLSGSPREFKYGEKIVLEWVNTSTTVIDFFRPLISFKDENSPSEEPSQQWYAMNEFMIIYPGTKLVTYHSIRKPGKPYGPYTPASEGIHSVISICPNTTSSGMVCTKMILTNADSLAPLPPTNINVNFKSSTIINISWDQPVIKGDIKEYSIYLNDSITYVTLTSPFTLPFLTPGKKYTLKINATDTSRNVGSFSLPYEFTMPVFSSSSKVINPFDDIRYEGAFLLPPDPGSGTENSFSFKLSGLAYHAEGDKDNVDGDQTNSGGLFVFGHIYHKKIAEISIPRPVKSTGKKLSDLPKAKMVQNFSTTFPASMPNPGYGYGDIAYYKPATGDPTLFTSVISFYQFEKKDPHLGSCNVDLSNTNPKGPWYIGPSNGLPNYYDAGSYLFVAPSEWATRVLNGNFLLAGTNRPGAFPQGPSLIAVSPLTQNGTTYVANGELPFKILIKYDSDDKSSKIVNGHHYGDTYYGGEWVSCGDKSAVAFCGRKGFGKQFYGYVDGTLYSDVVGDIPQNYPDGEKGANADRYESYMIFYDPADLERVARNELAPNEIQPYAGISMSPFLFSAKREFTDLAYDALNGFIYSSEFRGSEGDAKDIIHVWKVSDKWKPTKTLPYSPINKVKPTIQIDKSSLNISVPGSVGLIRCEIASLDGRIIIKKVFNSEKNSSIRVNNYKGLALVKLFLNDGTILVSSKILI